MAQHTVGRWLLRGFVRDASNPRRSESQPLIHEPQRIPDAAPEWFRGAGLFGRDGVRNQSMNTQSIQSQDIKISEVFQGFYSVPDYPAGICMAVRRAGRAVAERHFWRVERLRPGDGTGNIFIGGVSWFVRERTAFSTSSTGSSA
jgi:hypothetical protein